MTVTPDQGRMIAHVNALEAAVDRVRRMHPRGEEESNALAPGLWCPGCGEARQLKGWGSCRTRRTLDGESQMLR